MKNMAAEFIRRAAFVDANALLKDERVSNTGRFHTNEDSEGCHGFYPGGGCV